MVGSASPVISLGLYGSPWAIFVRQVLWMGVGTGALLVLSRVDYRKWRAILGPLVVVTMGLLVLVLVPDFGVTAGGSSRWIGVGLLRSSPPSSMKLALAVFAADLLTRRGDRLETRKVVIVPAARRPGRLGGPRPQATGHGDGPGARLHHLRDPVHGGCPAGSDHEDPGHHVGLA